MSSRPVKTFILPVPSPRLNSHLVRAERFLEKHGLGITAQKLRRKTHQLLGLSIYQWENLRKYVVEEENFRMVLQREAYLNEWSDRIREKLKEQNEENADRTRELEEEWKVVEGKLLWTSFSYTESAITLTQVQDVLKDTPVWRALEWRQRDPNWYLSGWLRSHCAANGGCCGRDCRCCEKSRSRREYDPRGHCTVVCICCEKARGYRIRTVNWVYPGRIHHDVQREDLDLETGLLMNALIWGL